MDDRPVLGLDADDTLWENEVHFRETERRFVELMAPWADGSTTEAALLDTERANVEITGYGVKCFVLSMVETAISLSDGAVGAEPISRVLEWGRQMLEAPVALLPDVAETIGTLADAHRLLLITKGDLTDQRRKVDASGLADHFWRIEVVAEKDTPTYRDILSRHGIDATEFVRVGNSVPSDVLPVLEAGGRAIHIPHDLTWALETATDSDIDGHEFPVLRSFGELPALLASWRDPG